METKIPQLSMAYTTSDENTPDSIIQMQERISLNVSIILPEVCLLQLLDFKGFDYTTQL